MNYKRNICLLFTMLLLCSCATNVPIPQQLAVPIVVEEGNVKYSLFCERKDYPGRFFVLPILEKQRLGQDVSRLYFKVEISRLNSKNLTIKGFLHSREIKGQKIIGDISGFEKSSVVVEVNLPTKDILNQAVVAWFVIESNSGPIFRSKKIHYTMGGM